MKGQFRTMGICHRGSHLSQEVQESFREEMAFNLELYVCFVVKGSRVCMLKEGVRAGGAVCEGT